MLESGVYIISAPPSLLNISLSPVFWADSLEPIRRLFSEENWLPLPQQPLTILHLEGALWIILHYWRDP